MNELSSSGTRDPVQSRGDVPPVMMNEYPSLNLIGDNDMMPLAYWRQQLQEDEELLGSSPSSHPLLSSSKEETVLHLHHVEEQQQQQQHPDYNRSEGANDDDGPAIKHLPFTVTESAATTHVACHSNPVTILEES